jgi:hypothetical protein
MKNARVKNTAVLNSPAASNVSQKWDLNGSNEREIHIQISANTGSKNIFKYFICTSRY